MYLDSKNIMIRRAQKECCDASEIAVCAAYSLYCRSSNQLTERNETHHHEFSVEILQQVFESVPITVHLDDMQYSFEDEQKH